MDLLCAVKPWWASYVTRFSVHPVEVPAPPGQKWGALMFSTPQWGLYVDSGFVNASPVEHVAGLIERELHRAVRDVRGRLRTVDPEFFAKYAHIAAELEICDVMRQEHVPLGVALAQDSRSCLFPRQRREEWGVREAPMVPPGSEWLPEAVGLEPGRTLEEYFADLVRAEKEAAAAESPPSGDSSDPSPGDGDLAPGEGPADARQSREKGSVSDEQPKGAPDHLEDSGASEAPTDGASGGPSPEPGDASGDGGGPEAPGSPDGDESGDASEGASGGGDGGTEHDGPGAPDAGPGDGALPAGPGDGGESGPAAPDPEDTPDGGMPGGAAPVDAGGARGTGAAPKVASAEARPDAEGARKPDGDPAPGEEPADARQSREKGPVGDEQSEGVPDRPEDSEASEDPTDGVFGGPSPEERIRELMRDPGRSWYSRDYEPLEPDPGPVGSTVRDAEALGQVAEDMRACAAAAPGAPGARPGQLSLTVAEDIIARVRVPWGKLLADALSDAAGEQAINGLQDVSYQVRNPNQPRTGVILPGMYGTPVNVCAVLDVSGSMRPHLPVMFGAFADVVFHAAGDNDDGVLWISVDSDVSAVGRCRSPSEIDPPEMSRGFGGTVIAPVIADLVAGRFSHRGVRHPAPDVIVVFTDCMWRFPWEDEARVPGTTSVVVASTVPWSRAWHGEPPGWIRKDRNWVFVDEDPPAAG